MAQTRQRAYIHRADTFGRRAADAIAASMGSWTFIVIQTLFVAGWVALNLVGLLNHWDPYPFILLNLLFSTQAAYAAPIIMMSQNRQAQKDHLRDDHEAAEVELLFKINQQQLEILHLLHGRLCPGEPVPTGPIEEIAEQARQLEAEARQVEGDLGVTAA